MIMGLKDNLYFFGNLLAEYVCLNIYDKRVIGDIHCFISICIFIVLYSKYILHYTTGYCIWVETEF